MRDEPITVSSLSAPVSQCTTRTRWPGSRDDRCGYSADTGGACANLGPGSQVHGSMATTGRDLVMAARMR
jgi:hypothetical protein